MKFFVAGLPSFSSLLLALTTWSSLNGGNNVVIVQAAGVTNIKHPFDELDKFKKIKDVINKAYKDNDEGTNDKENSKSNIPHRETQMDVDPCLNLPGFVDGFGLRHYTPSALRACLETVIIDGGSMLLHLESLRTIFRQYQ